MGDRREPIERQMAKAKGDGRTPGKRELTPVQFTIAKRKDMPPMPRGLGPTGKREWHKIWNSGPWLNIDQDYHWVSQVCYAYDDVATFRARVQADGLVQTGYAGQVVAHPLIAEIRKAEATIRSCLSVLGYSPTDRARLGLAEVKRQSALEDLIAKAA